VKSIASSAQFHRPWDTKEINDLASALWRKIVLYDFHTTYVIRSFAVIGPLAGSILAVHAGADPR
jgi:hypothetical protein